MPNFIQIFIKTMNRKGQLSRLKAISDHLPFLYTIALVTKTCQSFLQHIYRIFIIFLKKQNKAFFMIINMLVVANLENKSVQKNKKYPEVTTITSQLCYIQPGWLLASYFTPGCFSFLNWKSMGTFVNLLIRFINKFVTKPQQNFIVVNLTN